MRVRTLPGGLYRRTVHIWPPAPRLLPGQIYPTHLTAEDLAEILGGLALYEVYALTVTVPEPRTWYLAAVDLDADALYPGSPAYRGLVRQGSGALASLAESSCELLLRDDFGTRGAGGGPRRRFSDWFAAPAPGFAVPYDLASATLTASLVWPGLGESEVRPIGRYRLRREATTWDAGPPATFALSFGPDRARIFRPLPRRTATDTLWPGAADGVRGVALPLLLGRDRLRPLLAVDPSQGLYLAGESPADTPLPAVTGALHVIQADLETGEDRAVPIEPLPNGTPPVLAYDPATTVTWRDLTQRARRLNAVTPTLLSQIRIRMREKTGGGGTPTGRVSIRAETDANGQPSGELAHPNAAEEFDAATVLSDAFYPNSSTEGLFTRPCVLPDDRPVWLVLRHQSDGGDVIQVAVEAPGADPNGYDATKAAGTDDDWKVVGKHKEVKLGTGLTQDGYLVRPGANGLPEVFDHSHYRHGNKVCYIGREVRKGVLQTMRSFLRFPISTLPAAPPAAFLSITLQARSSPIPVGDVRLVEVTDVGTLADADWDAGIRAELDADFISPTVDPVAHFDVLARYTQAKTDGLTHLAFRLEYTAESSLVPGWYTVWAGGSSHRPRLTVVTSAGEDVRYQLVSIAPTWTPAYVDAEGVRVGMIQLLDAAGVGVDLGDQRLALQLDGMTDATGAYGPAPGGVIDRPQDLLRWVARHPMGCGLPEADVDGEALYRLGLDLADWFALAGEITDVQDAQVHLARLCHAARAFVFLDQRGRLSVGSDVPHDTPVVRRVRAWEHGALRMLPRTTAEGPAVWPVTQVAVGYDRDAVGLAPPRGRRVPVSGYAGYAIISAAQTDPPDPIRQTQAVALEAAYGVLTGRAPGDPVAVQTFDWVPRETPGLPTGSRVAALLWDQSLARPQPFDWIEVELPGFARPWGLGTEFSLESYQFPSANAVYLRGECGWATGGAMGLVFGGGLDTLARRLAALGSTLPVPDTVLDPDDRLILLEALIPGGAGSAFLPDPLAWCQARRGRFRVDAIRPRGLVGADAPTPVAVTATLLRWETD